MSQTSSMSALQQLINERIQREGAITFAEYMRMALYEPGHGYYVTGPARMGWEGDYYTSSDVSTLFASCMGRQLHQMWQQLNQPAIFSVLEQGAGRGNLATDIRAWTEKTHPDFHAALHYHTTDINSGQDALASTTNQLSPSVILSNELVDAFPVHVLHKHEGRLYEVYVGLQDGHLYELLDEPSSPEVATYLDSYKIPWHTFEDGWRAEVNLAALHWMERTAQLLMGTAPKGKRRGFILTIDYGDSASNLYTNYRLHGTLASYFQHQFTERPLARPGAQDITAHVNFTALLNTGRRQGLRLHALTTQRQWLTNMGIYEELQQMRQSDFAILDSARATDQGQVALLQWYNLRQRVTALTSPEGMGNFKVLILKR